MYMRFFKMTLFPHPHLIICFMCNSKGIPVFTLSQPTLKLPA